jgi:hypothetical protein
MQRRKRLAALVGQVAQMVVEARYGVTEKSVSGIVLDFKTRLTSFAVEAFEGKMDKIDLQRAMRALLKQDASEVYIEGMIEGGFESEEDARANMDEPDTSAIKDWYTTQSAFVGEFAKAAVAARTADDRTGAQQSIFNRCDLWAQSLDSLGGLGRASAQANKPGTWKLGKTEEHCETCAQLNGQRHRVKWFISRGYLPRQPGSEMLECGGWNCDCSIVSDDGELIL